ncbi:TPA: GTPase ObgE [Candidatus Saccharibacteria bacterium]|nr:GTPase ObgE [Candidatus Saccharibacteria bacterium]HRK40684.1 GTPase ObgE [Candidatus Saccharibacteria bacterium]
MFVDSATVFVTAGRGGDGRVSFRTEKYVEKGGPDGGDGGKGGDVIFVADENTSTLVDFRIKQELKAENGEPGGIRRRHGKNGTDRTVKVPVGTMIIRDGELIADMTAPGQRVVVAKGGDGGFGNAHFKSSTRQAPRVAELGEKGEAFEASLELKLIADVGLVGFPNAGKSTFLSVVSNARPEIADYAFTTLTPNLGVADIDDTSLLIADIPGLIEGASEGKGLGDAFLRHIERTAVILHLIDAYSDDPGQAYLTIRKELENYSDTLAKLPEVVVLSKTDGLDTEIVDHQKAAIVAVAAKGSTVLAMSSTAKQGTTEVLRALAATVRTVRAKQAETLAQTEDETDETIISLSTRQLDDGWRVREEEGAYIVTGPKIERFAARTDYGNVHSINRLRDIMKKMGITHELLRKGASGEDLIRFGEEGASQMTLEEIS